MTQAQQYLYGTSKERAVQLAEAVEAASKGQAVQRESHASYATCAWHGFALLFATGCILFMI